MKETTQKIKYPFTLAGILFIIYPIVYVITYYMLYKYSWNNNFFEHLSIFYYAPIYWQLLPYVTLGIVLLCRKHNAFVTVLLIALSLLNSEMFLYNTYILLFSLSLGFVRSFIAGAAHLAAFVMLVIFSVVACKDEKGISKIYNLWYIPMVLSAIAYILNIADAGIPFLDSSIYSYVDAVFVKLLLYIAISLLGWWFKVCANHKQINRELPTF